MTREEFDAKYNDSRKTGKFYGSKDDVIVYCNTCGKEAVCQKFNAQENIKKNNGVYIDKSCKMVSKHKENPVSDETRKKISDALTGKKKSEESKKKMSESKKALYLSADGEALKRELSLITSRQHAAGYFSRPIHGYFPSEKANQPLYFSSSYELRLLYLLSKDENIKKIESQIAIEIHGRGRCVDTISTDKDGNKCVFEVKPEWNIDNCSEQIQDIQEYARINGYKFKVWSEKDTGIENCKEIYNWALSMLPEHVRELKKVEMIERNNNRAKKHYDNVISKDKVLVDCEFCLKKTGVQVIHEVLRVNYNKNTKDHDGKYICGQETSHINGSLPKLHLRKENPYAAEGKKQCAGACKNIMSLDDFGTDKEKPDGKARVCKKCRAEANSKKYHDKKVNFIEPL